VDNEKTVVDAAKSFGEGRRNYHIINISSNLGSLTSTSETFRWSCLDWCSDRYRLPVCDGWNLAYRISKVALNMATATLAKEFQENGVNIAVIALNPGYVPTRMTNFRAPDNMDERIAGIVKVNEKAGMDQTGGFLDWRGNTLLVICSLSCASESQTDYHNERGVHLLA